MMEYLEFIKVLCKKSLKHQLVWMNIFANIDPEKNTSVSVFEIMAKSRVTSIQTLYPILRFGISFFNDDRHEYKFALKTNEIYIYKSIDADKFTFLKNNSRTSEKSKVERKKSNNKPIAKLPKKSIIKTLEIFDNATKKIIDYFNEKTKSSIGYDNREFVNNINARLREGFSLENFFFVIDTKSKEWGDISHLKIHLRAKTIFGEKMEDYIKPSIAKIQNKAKPTIDKMQQSHESSQHAKELLRGLSGTKNQ